MSENAAACVSDGICPNAGPRATRYTSAPTISHPRPRANSYARRCIERLMSVLETSSHNENRVAYVIVGLESIEAHNAHDEVGARDAPAGHLAHSASICRAELNVDVAVSDGRSQSG